MNLSSRLRTALVLVVVLVLQLSVASQLNPIGVHADLLLLTAVAAGISWGPERGAVVGFVAGFAADLFQQAPFGLSMLVFCLIGFAVGSLQSGVLRSAWWIPVLTAATASAVGVVAWAVAGTVLGQQGLINPRLVAIAGLVALWNGPLSLGVLRMLSWAEGGSAARRMVA